MFSTYEQNENVDKINDFPEDNKKKQTQDSIQPKKGFKKFFSSDDKKKLIDQNNKKNKLKTKDKK